MLLDLVAAYAFYILSPSAKLNEELCSTFLKKLPADLLSDVSF
jgi:hypothetical protein